MFVRVQVSSIAGKARKARKELERSGLIQGAVTIARIGEDDYRVISEMTLDDIIVALFAAAKGINNAKDKEIEGASKIELDHKTHEPVDPRERLGKRRNPEIKQDADGTMHAPPGETFIFCAECGGARWFMTQQEFSMGPFARCVCVSCGNELKFVTAGPEGRA